MSYSSQTSPIENPANRIVEGLRGQQYSFDNTIFYVNKVNSNGIGQKPRFALHKDLLLLMLPQKEGSAPLDNTALLKVKNFEIQCFLEEVYQLDKDGNKQDAGDKVFGFIDNLLSEGLFDTCNEILARVDISKLSTSIMRAFLEITYAARDKLAVRSTLYHKIMKEMIAKRGEQMARRLLGRLI